MGVTFNESARANLFASGAAGEWAIVGSLHAGANVEVIEMLGWIRAGGVSPKECICMAKDKSSDCRLYGFGQRVYRTYDSRAKILREACHRVFAQFN